MNKRDWELLHRRSFLKAAAGFGGSMMLGTVPFRAFADATNLAPADRCFVFAYFGGGWDVLLSLDPRDPNVFTPDRTAETRILPGYSLLSQDPSFPQTMVTPATRMGAAPSNIQFGPAIGRMADHYDLCCVVRGMNMNTVAHEVGYRYFLTGKEPNGSSARGSSTATEIVGQMKPNVPVPSVAYGVESYNDRYPGAANALNVARSADLILTLAPAPTALDSEIEKQLVNLRGQSVTCEADAYDTRGLITQYRQSRSQMGTVLSQQLDNSFRFERPENAAVRQAYGLGTSGPYDTAAGRAALVGTALKKGISQCVSINLVGGLDTHFGTQVTHATNQRTGWNALADLVTDLRSSAHPSGGNFMDHTTIVVFSEFSRTPMINGSGGRDHHISSSCLIVGAGFKHNMVFGKSGDVGLTAGRVNFDTGLPDDKGFNILPEDIVASVLGSANLDYSITRTRPIKAILADHV
ncbi:MAG: DUF1501 domain-containing protein [Archangiaceae bacterium]|nr:DUF1501 domain-containing protein [Archangiaceae bacterium]